MWAGAVPGRSSSAARCATRSAVTSLGPTRASLIAKGLVFSPEYGHVAYTVPGMAEYVRRREDVEP